MSGRVPSGYQRRRRRVRRVPDNAARLEGSSLNSQSSPTIGFGTGLLLCTMYSVIVIYRAVDRLLAWLGAGSMNRQALGMRALFDAAGTSFEPDATIGPILTRRDAPRLFRLLSTICRRMGTACPAEVRIAFLPACGVLDLGNSVKDGRQVLVVGLPCFEIWTTAEFEAVLAHELAHLKLEDAAFMREVLGFSYALRQMTHGRNGWDLWLNPRVLLARGVGASLVLFAAPISRAMEFRADRWSADYCGGSSLASALERLAIVQPVFREVLSLFDPLADPRKNVYDFFAALWRRLPPVKYRQLRCRLVDHCSSEYWDRHPPLIDRLRRLSEMPAKQQSSLEPATELLEDPAELKSLLHNRLYGTHLKPVSVFEREGGQVNRSKKAL